MESSSWTPVFTAGDRARIVPVLETIAADLSKPDIIRFWGPSWSEGAAGVALFFWYLWKETSNRKWRQQAHDWLQQSVELASRREVGLALFSGAAGIAWTVAHFGQELPSFAACDLPLVTDNRLLERIGQPQPDEDYDLMRGLVGYGVYALTRQAHPNGPALLARILDRLAEIAITSGDGIAWRTATAGSPIDLGLAHGVPGVVALLGHACETGVQQGVARRLLDQSANWLLAQRNPDHVRSCFGTRAYIDASQHDPQASRVAWCYGDLGIAAALYSTATAVRREDWKQTALDMARRTARRPLDDSGVKDAQLCHGSAGNGHIFNCFYQATREESFLEAARRWFERTLAFHEPGSGCGGFQRWIPTPGPVSALQRNSPGLVSGAAGIGLALLAAISAVEPEWDRLLLVTLSPDPFKPRAPVPGTMMAPPR